MPGLPEPSWPISDGVVALRRFTVDDVADVTKACQDPEIARWTASIPSPYEARHAEWWISQHDTQWAEGTHATFAFCPASHRDLLGSMTLEEVDLDWKTAAVGYWAAPWARNRGATTRALELVCRWGFDVVDLKTVNLVTMVGNGASERVAEKAGFRLVEQISQYKPMVARDLDAAYEVRHWIRENQ